MSFLACLGRTAVAGSLAVAALAFPQNSSAAVGDLSCIGIGNSTLTFSPPLTNTAQTVTITSTNTFPNCTSSDPAITSAHIATSVHTGTRSCTSLLNTAPAPGPLTITYNTSENTTYDSTFLANYFLGTLTVTDSGPVTSGKFPGATVIGVAAYVPDLTRCLPGGPGIATLNGNYSINTL